MFIKYDVENQLKKGSIEKDGYCNFESYPCNL